MSKARKRVVAIISGEQAGELLGRWKIDLRQWCNRLRLEPHRGGLCCDLDCLAGLRVTPHTRLACLAQLRLDKNSSNLNASALSYVSFDHVVECIQEIANITL